MAFDAWKDARDLKYGRDGTTSSDLYDALLDSQRRVLAATIINAFTYGLILAFTSVSIRFIWCTPTKTRTRVFLLSHSLLTLGLATAYSLLCLFSQKDFFGYAAQSVAADSYFDLWQQSKAATIVWAISIWHADAFMLYMEYLAWRSRQPFNWLSALLYAGYLVGGAFGIVADLGMVMIMCFVVSILIHTCSVILLIWRVIILIRIRHSSRGQPFVHETPADPPIPSFIMNGGVYTITRVIWILAIYIVNISYWVNFIVSAGAVIALHLVVMHILSRHPNRSAVAPAVTLKVPSPTISVVTLSEKPPLSTSSTETTTTNLVMDHTGTETKFWSRLRPRADTSV